VAEIAWRDFGGSLKKPWFFHSDRTYHQTCIPPNLAAKKFARLIPEALPVQSLPAGRHGIDFYGIREYPTGDAQRQINWKIASVTTRGCFTMFMSKRTFVADVGIVLDAGSQSTEKDSPSGSISNIRSSDGLPLFAEYFLEEGQPG
jgi:hypothetical protein